MTISEQLYFTKKLRVSRYPNGQLALNFVGLSGEPIAELSIMEDSVELASNEFILKDYSENEDIVQECYESKMFFPTNRFVLVGSHLCPICQINI